MDRQKSYSMSRQDVFPALIVSPALLSPGQAGYGDAPIEERRRLGVLAFGVLYDKAKLRVVGIDRKGNRPTCWVGVTSQEIESMLARGYLPDNPIA